MAERVLVTGASGFVGRMVLAPLAGRGFEVHAVSRRPPAGGATWHQADLLDGAEQHRLLRDIRPTLLVHAAWYVEHGRFWTAPENADWLEASAALADTSNLVNVNSSRSTGLSGTEASASKSNRISLGFSPCAWLSFDGEGLSTTDGMRWCFLPPDGALASGSREPAEEANGLGGGGDDSIDESDETACKGWGATTWGPFAGGGALNTRLIVSPSLTVYSLSNFWSARALPLSKSLWFSAVGSSSGCRVWICSLMERIVSVGDTG